jgi:hypothetical protein
MKAARPEEANPPKWTREEMQGVTTELATMWQGWHFSRYFAVTLFCVSLYFAVNT